MSEALAYLRETTGLVGNETDWPDARLQRFLDNAKVRDDEGRESDDEDYETTYDLNRAAAQVFRARAADAAPHGFQTQMDQAATHRQQIVENYHRLARDHDKRSRARAIKMRMRDVVAE